jgi:hypothetical protein
MFRLISENKSKKKNISRNDFVKIDIADQDKTYTKHLAKGFFSLQKVARIYTLGSHNMPVRVIYK